ncbi:uncharacterized protein LTR77_004893 [Saxophila tyrrhenica]|uniref:DUF8032 domain-containing protein n=1 Tax=Saxophila tyrrhenica TaxID=1690608 RepID=A0AAV9PAT1_9PEZI|nr:hypothetical protein LTR77_004893 [Saxophila tyrrhenica]
MATQAAMSRPPGYPPISSYQTPQSNSPASIHSPQTDAHGRPLYGMPPMAQQMYYPQTYQMQQSPYAQHAPSSHHPSITSAPGPLMPYQSSVQQQPQHQSQQQPGNLDTKPSLSSLQRPPSVIAPPHGTPQTPSGSQAPGVPNSATGPNPSAAPGPIPATTPLVVRQDNNGVQWIAFEYSRDRVKMEYTIRCDVESVNTEELSAEFKSANCVYPRACSGKDQYKGNRLQYETECNAVGWALAQLNPPLREKRGLIQRAVDSWRNSNQDVKLRSRRVRRMAKMHTRKTNVNMVPGAAGQPPGPQGPPSAGAQTSQARPPDFAAGGMMPQHHHHVDPNQTVGGGGGVHSMYHI